MIHQALARTTLALGSGIYRVATILNLGAEEKTTDHIQPLPPPSPERLPFRPSHQAIISENPLSSYLAMSSLLCHRLYFALCLFYSLAYCTTILQSNWDTAGFSGLTSRAISNGDDLMSFDDMPDCAKQGCLPFDPSIIGCSEDMTIACYCAGRKFSRTGCSKCSPSDSFDRWMGHICLGIPLSSFDNIPPCAKSCIKEGDIQNSCSLNSWDCFCASEVLAQSCLTKCSAADKATMKQWRVDECVGYEKSVPSSTTVKSSTTSKPSTTVKSSTTGESGTTNSAASEETTAGGEAVFQTPSSGCRQWGVPR